MPQPPQKALRPGHAMSAPVRTSGVALQLAKLRHCPRIRQGQQGAGAAHQAAALQGGEQKRGGVGAEQGGAD